MCFWLRGVTCLVMITIYVKDVDNLWSRFGCLVMEITGYIYIYIYIYMLSGSFFICFESSWMCFREDCVLY